MRTDENGARNQAAKRPRRAVTRAVLYLTVGVGAAVGAAFLLTRYMDARTAAARVPTEQVVVARVGIPPATAIKSEWLTLVEWPTASKPEGTSGEVKSLEGRVAIGPILKGEPILASKLAQAGANGGLSALVPEGMRAVAVRVDDVVGVAGFLHPGDSVDVIVTMKPRENSSEFASKVILQNVKVLAVGKDVQHRGREAEKAVPATVATLMVTPAQSEELALGAAKGKLLLTLRGAGDDELADTSGALPHVLFASVARETPRAPAASPPPARTRPQSKREGAPERPPEQKQTVEVIRGDLFEKRDFAKAGEK